MARNELSQAYRDTLKFGEEHPLQFAANVFAVVDGAVVLSKVGLRAAGAVGSVGMERLAAKALADADEAGMPAWRRNQLIDAASKYQQIAYQMKQGRSLQAIRVISGRDVEFPR